MIARTKVLICVAAVLFVSSWHFVNAQDDEKNPREMFQEARMATSNGDFAKAAEILTKLNEQTPGNALIEFNLGYNLHGAGKIDEAIVFHKKAVASDQFKPTALYNLGCAYSIKEEADQAFDYLKQSIDAGFREMDQLTGDPDFENIKSDPRFKEMIALIENDGKEPAKKLKAEDLYGSWKIESGSRSGSKVDSARLPTIKITKESFTIPAGPEGEFVMSYKWDLDTKPMTIDFNIESGPAPADSKAQGIIKIHDDGKMSLCYEPKGEKRPEKFLSTEENGFFVFKMKKVEDKTMVKGGKVDMAKSILGNWKCVKGKRAGDDIGAERMASIISIDEKLITIPIGQDQAFKMSYSIDSSSNPIAIDMKIEEGPAPEGSKALGIIKMEDGKFFLCYDPDGTKRPDKFESSEDDGRFLFEMESHKE